MSFLKYLTSEQMDKIGYYDAPPVIKIPSIIDFDYRTILEKPPLNSSQQTIDELNKISILTINRTDQDTKIIQAIDDDPTIGVKNLCKLENIIFDTEVFNKWFECTKDLIYAIKNFYNRPRPKQLADIYNISINVIESKTAETPAYPSGHTVYTQLAANMVLEKYPELKDKLYTIVMTTAYARCCQGVHFPSDNTASIFLADYIYKKLKTKIKV